MSYLQIALDILQEETFQHYLIIYSLFLITWWKSVYGGWLIDDSEGIQCFSDKWRSEGKEPNGNIIPELEVNYYNQDVGKDENNKPIVKAFKNLQYNPYLGFPGAFMRWHRLQIGKKFQVIGKNKKGHEVYGFVQNPFRHHLWSLFVYGISLFFCYNFLSYQFGPNIAFPATLLFAIHPVISQCVAWISGVNYLYCLTFLLANYNMLQLGLNYSWSIPLTILFTALSSLSLLVGCFNFSVLWVLGYHWEAFAALIVGIIVMLKDGLGVVNYRRAEFKKQNMISTITPNIRKPIVMIKSLFYYICLVVFPQRLGLYHEKFYHYSRKDEEPDFGFWMGFLSIVGMGLGFYYGDLIVRLCVVWFLSYWITFSNFITANQAFSERYIFIPSLSFCILFGNFLYPYKPLFWFLIGLYAMRSIMHVWTFKDHISFYQSNIQNFPKSEVAYGNLGVAYQGRGMSGAAFDFWMEATKINSLYDVPWYNMHSLLKTQGILEQAREYLKNCMNAKIVHFQGTWEKEMQDLDSAILKKQCFEALNKELNDAIASGQNNLIPEIKKKMDVLMDPKTVVQMTKT